MCYSPTTSACLAAVSAVLAVRLYQQRDQTCFLWALFAFYAGMELLQTFQHRTVNQCDSKENQVLAFIAFLYVLVQPFFWNYYAWKCKSSTPFQRGVFVSAMALNFVMIISFLLRLGTAPAGESTPLNDMLSGPLCTKQDDNQHLRWSWPIGPSVSGSATWFMYFALWFVPLLFADDGLALSGGIAAGAVITYLVVRNKQEFPAVWCIFSIPFLILGTVTSLSL